MGAGVVAGLVGLAVAGKGGAALGGMMQFGFFAAVGVFATCCTFAPRRALTSPKITATIGTANPKVARAVCAIAMFVFGGMAMAVLAGRLANSQRPVTEEERAKVEAAREAEYRARVEAQRVRATETSPPAAGEIAPLAPPVEVATLVTESALHVSNFVLEATTRNPPGITFTIRIQGGKGESRDMWAGIGDLEVMKKFATQVKGPIANRLGLLELNGPGFYIAPCKEWNPVPDKPGLSRGKLNFEKVTLARSSALVSIIVFDDGGGAVIQSSQVDFETGKAGPAGVWPANSQTEPSSIPQAQNTEVPIQGAVAPPASATALPAPAPGKPAYKTRKR